ncbi:MAG TPA: aminopeptidase P N-terminal domain-containing protein, partial [Gammaproteobacteria bacterium]|nr:aminopeptidase P N-terminal domain-containing protein [Gammaproteobacteria bacterium]
MESHQNVKAYIDRRLKILAQMSPNSACFIPANKKILRNGDAEYPFRQNSSLYHVTGWPEDLALLVLTKKNNQHKTIFFCHEQDAMTSRWVGERLGTLRARQEYGMEEA